MFAFKYRWGVKSVVVLASNLKQLFSSLFSTLPDLVVMFANRFRVYFSRFSFTHDLTPFNYSELFKKWRDEKFTSRYRLIGNWSKITTTPITKKILETFLEILPRCQLVYFSYCFSKSSALIQCTWLNTVLFLAVCMILMGRQLSTVRPFLYSETSWRNRSCPGKQ